MIILFCRDVRTLVSDILHLGMIVFVTAVLSPIPRRERTLLYGSFPMALFPAHFVTVSALTLSDFVRTIVGDNYLFVVEQ